MSHKCLVNIMRFITLFLSSVYAVSGVLIVRDWVVTVKEGFDCGEAKEEIESRGVFLLGDENDGSPPVIDVADDHGDCFISFSGDSVFVFSELAQLPFVESIELDEVVAVGQQSNLRPEVIDEATVPKSWGLDRVDQINMPLSHTPLSLTHYGKNVDVYVVDTGIRVTHKDFGGRARNGIDFSGDGLADGYGHGTHCAGTVGGKTYGIAREALIWNVKVLNNRGYGQIINVIKGLQYATAQHKRRKAKASVISMSLGGGQSNALNKAVKTAWDNGLVVVVAAGNSNADACKFSPAMAGGKGNVISVGATTIEDKVAQFSNYGKCVDIYAPGSVIYSCGHRSDTDERVLSGTSMACPHVAGVMAALLEKNKYNRKNAVDELYSVGVKNLLKTFKGTGKNILLQGPFGQGEYTPAPTTAPTIPVVTTIDCGIESNQCYYAPFGPHPFLINGELVYSKIKGCGNDTVEGMFKGKIAMVEWGQCSINEKVHNAEVRGGAIGVIVYMKKSRRPFVPPRREEDDFPSTVPSAVMSYKYSKQLQKCCDGAQVAFTS